MKKLDSFFLLIIALTLISTACSSTKSSSKKGGGWYQNRNVNHQNAGEQESIVYQSQESISECLNHLE